MKSTACLEPILASCFASTHLVNLLTATSRWVKPLGAFLKRPRRFRPHIVKGQVMGVGGHKMYIFIANIPTFHSRYRRKVFITNEFHEFC
jgi:hypothetical protein